MRQADTDDDDDRELPDQSDLDDDGDDTETVTCPNCGHDVYEQAQSCPKCGNYLTLEGSRRSRRPKWVIAGVVVCLLIVVFVWILR